MLEDITLKILLWFLDQNSTLVHVTVLSFETSPYFWELAKFSLSMVTGRCFNIFHFILFKQKFFLERTKLHPVVAPTRIMKLFITKNWGKFWLNHFYSSHRFLDSIINLFILRWRMTFMFFLKQSLNLQLHFKLEM